MIKYPVTVELTEGPYSLLRDAEGRAIAGGLNPEDAEEIAARLNAPQRRSKRERDEEALRASDLTAQGAGRDDIEYGFHESLPRGEHVARLGRKQ